jgi:hypothetical protein
MSLSYYKVGTKENPILSNSSLSALNPEEGGSIVKFLNFFGSDEEERTEIESQALTNGRLVHKYIEDSSKFVVEGEKPTDMMVGLLEKVAGYALDFQQVGFNQDVDASLVPEAKSAKTAEAEILQLRAGFEQLAGLLKLNVEAAVKIFRAARIETNSYKSRTELTLLQDILSDKKEAKEIPYLKFLMSARGKTILTNQDKITVDGMCNSLYTHPTVSELLGLREDDFGTAIQWEIFREQPVFWKEIHSFEDEKKIQVNCKALLDRLRVCHALKKIQYVDLKSTKGSLYTFQSAFEYYRYYRQMAFYRRAIGFFMKAVYPDVDVSRYDLEVFIVPVENKGLFLTGIYAVDIFWLGKGMVEAKGLLGRYAWHVRNGEYRYSPEEHGVDGVYRPLTFKKPEN